MRIGLIDVDSHNFPNIPLMKLSAYHKAKGDLVEWYDPLAEEYDIVYMSKVFSFSDDYLYPINAKKIIKGGSGYCIETIDGKEVYKLENDKNLPHEIEHIYPDYSLYPTLTENTAYGRLTLGCPRRCSFCHTGVKDGVRSHKVANLSEFWNGQKNIVLLDQNILACRDWKELLQQLIDSKADVDFNGGLDVRMMTEEKAMMLKQIKQKVVHFAWDRYEDKEIIIPKLKLFKDITKWNERKLVVFVLVNYNTTIQQDLERIYTLRELGYWAYVMIYDKESLPRGHIYKKLQRWVNNRFTFGKCKTFVEYLEYMKNMDLISEDLRNYDRSIKRIT